MDRTILNAIRSFVASEPMPTVSDFLDRDAPKFDWTRALVGAMAGQQILARDDQGSGETHLIADDGTIVLRITSATSGGRVTEGLFATDFGAFLSAIRIHEVESYDLVMLPPDLRKADVDRLCKKAGISADTLRRLSNIWVSQI